LAGLGHLRFRKPWSPSFSSTNNVFFSTIEAYGFAMNGEWHSRDSGVIDNFLEIDFLYGGGDFQILDDTKLSSLVSDDFSVGCIAGGVTGGVEYDWIDMDGVDLYTTVFAGIWASHFFISYSEEEEEDGHTLPLTSDLRVHLGAEVRARF